MNVIENFGTKPKLLFRDLIPGQVFKWVNYPLTEQPVFMKQDGNQYTALTAVCSEEPFVEPGVVHSQGFNSEVILLRATLTVSLA